MAIRYLHSTPKTTSSHANMNPQNDKPEPRTRTTMSNGTPLRIQYHMNKFNRSYDVSDEHRGQTVRFRKVVLDSDLSKPADSIIYAGNIVRDIECIGQTQNEDEKRAEEWKLIFKKLYGLSFELRGDILKAPGALVETCDMLWTCQTVNPWVDDEEVAGYRCMLEEFIVGWESAMRDGKGDEYWNSEANVSKFEQVKKWYDYGVYGLDGEPEYNGYIWG